MSRNAFENEIGFISNSKQVEQFRKSAFLKPNIGLYIYIYIKSALKLKPPLLLLLLRPATLSSCALTAAIFRSKTTISPSAFDRADELSCWKQR
jgi:hypothetical protein